MEDTQEVPIRLHFSVPERSVVATVDFTPQEARPDWLTWEASGAAQSWIHEQGWGAGDFVIRSEWALADDSDHAVATGKDVAQVQARGAIDWLNARRTVGDQ